jgi:ADP-ribose pyrophosphatase
MPGRVPELAAEKTLSTEIIFEGRAVCLRVDTVETIDGRKTTREIVEHAGCIAVVAVDSDDNILLVKQFRKPLEREILEIPAGGIDTGEDTETAVIREMQEETGLRPQKLERLCGFYSSPGFCTEYLTLYLATGLVAGRLYAEDTGGIEVIRVPVTQIPELLVSGKIEDAKTIAGLLFYLKYRKSG